MKHLEVTSLKQFSIVFLSETFKRKKELLAEAVLHTVVPFEKDKETAEKLSKDLADLANEIMEDSDWLRKKLLEAAEQNGHASADFVDPLRKESERLKALVEGTGSEIPPKKQWNFHKRKGASAV